MLDLQVPTVFLYFCNTGYVLLFNSNYFRRFAEYAKMQKQTSQTLFSRALLTPKRVPSRHLHSSIVHHPVPIDHLIPRSSASRLAKKRYLEAVTGFCLKRQVRRGSTIEKAISAEKEKQNKAPWHREGSDMPPVARQRSAGAMVKGARVPTFCASTLTKLRLRKAIDDPVSPSQTHHTSYHS